MFNKIAKVFGIDSNKRQMDQLSQIVRKINDLEQNYEALGEDALRAKTEEFRAQVQERIGEPENENERQRLEQEALDEILPEAFAAVREAAKRKLGLRPYDVQLIGGIVLHQGKIAEMRTGEGKTLVATLPMYLNGLTGRGVHLVTVNDYLARRDARWMAPVFDALGLSVGVLQMASRGDGGPSAYLVDLKKESVHEDQNQLRLVQRREAYQADITYGTNSEFGFDYLRDNLAGRMADRVQRGHYFAIVDEVDNILIDEARTPLIISGPSQDDTRWFVNMAQVVRQLNDEDYEINEKDRAISLTEVGEAHVEQVLQMPLSDPDNEGELTTEQAQLMGYLEQALRAQFLYRRNKDYLVQGGKVIIIDEFTGRLMPGRRWSDGLHQAVEAKEGARVEPENITNATITIQNYFRMYQKLSGMSGTAVTEAEEFYKIYKLDVLPIPTNLEFIAVQPNSPYLVIEAKDKAGYKYVFYADRQDSQRTPRFFRRQDFPDKVYRTSEAKQRAITEEIVTHNAVGRPLLVGSTSVENSDLLSRRLGADMVRRLLFVLLIRDIFLEKKKISLPERAVPELQPLYQPLDKLDTTTLRKIAKDLDIEVSFDLDRPENLERLTRVLGLQSEEKERLQKIWQSGITHQVLNARRHAEEAQIIAHAGAFGVVTIATNMAGRGVDIKLGGEFDENLLETINNHVLSRDTVKKLYGKEPYDISHEQRYELIRRMKPEEFGIYEAQVQAFVNYMQQMEQVRELGGLHVIASERHEARRIDNQLRGRAARQGDPGSSRFYMALDDELMRLFGGQQVEGLMARLNIEESLPIESGLVGRLVEQSQERVEGANFDTRKHLLEYDDVLNNQRKRIYELRDRALTKADLLEDVDEMLQTELSRRIPEALKDEEGPWRLISYLENIQPTIIDGNIYYPSYGLRLLIEDVLQHLPADTDAEARARALREGLLQLARRMFEAENTHILKSVDKSLVHFHEFLGSQRSERMEVLDNFIDSLPDRIEEAGSLRPQELAEEAGALLRIPQLRLTSEQMRSIEQEDFAALRDSLAERVDVYLVSFTIKRALGDIKRRLGEGLNLDANQLAREGWEAAEEQMMIALESLLRVIYDRFLAEKGPVDSGIETGLKKYGYYTEDVAQLTEVIDSIEARQTVYSKHQRMESRRKLLNAAYLAAHLIQEQNLSPEQVTEQVSAHLEGARETLRRIGAQREWLWLTQNNKRLNQMDPNLRARLEEFLDDEYAAIADQPLETFTPEQRGRVEEVLAYFNQNEILRNLLITAVTQEWMDYLTSMEALRVSIGLEAYAQRDPLVQYKSRASEMFQKLLADIRSTVIRYMFSYRPHSTIGRVIDQQRLEAGEVPELALESPGGLAPEAITSGAPTSSPADARPTGSGRRNRHKKR